MKENKSSDEQKNFYVEYHVLKKNESNFMDASLSITSVRKKGIVTKR